MGTNFYLGRSRTDSQHVGKRFGAGHGEVGFILQAFHQTDGGPLTTWKQWRAIIEAVGIVTDEYGTEHEACDFIAQVEAAPEWARRRQAEMLYEQGIPVNCALPSPEAQSTMALALRTQDFVDPDGFSFSFSDFT